MEFDFGPIMDANIASYTVGFVLLDGSTPKPLGSGTLVRCQTVQGILTCGHVLAELPVSSDFGIAQLGLAESRDQRIQLSGTTTVAHGLALYKPPTTRDGPDLAFLPVPVAEFANLAARGSVLNLDVEMQKAASDRPSGADVLEAVAGILGQMTAAATISGNKRTLILEGLVCPGSVIASSKVGQWDQLHFKPLPQLESKLPTSYQGTSGGGIWRIFLQRTANDGYDVLETRLTGVAYWQDQVDGSLGVIGHGPESIYRHLLTEIYRLWPL